MALPDIVVARIYDRPGPERYRVLVDRLWPRGVARADAPMDEWLPAVAPSTQLRKWYAHAPERFDEFQRRYRAELAEGERAEALAGLAARSAKQPLALLTAVRDTEISQAAVLAEVLRSRS